jgi:cysteinylglycine-S-conjugate dipeptidase
MHLTALRALGEEVPVNLKLVVEGSEEQGTGGLEDFVPRHADLLRADAILVCDTGNAEVGLPAVTISLRGLANVVVSVEALRSEVHSGMFGGPAPDALAALIRMLATLRDDAGETTVAGLGNTQTWDGVDYPAERFRTDAGLLDGVSVLGAARSRTWCGPDRPSPCSASTARRSSARPPPSSHAPGPGSTCGSRRAWTRSRRRTRSSRTCTTRHHGACG